MWRFFCIYVMGCYLFISNNVYVLERLVESEEREIVGSEGSRGNFGMSQRY